MFEWIVLFKNIFSWKEKPSVSSSINFWAFLTIQFITHKNFGPWVSFILADKVTWAVAVASVWHWRSHLTPSPTSTWVPTTKRPESLNSEKFWKSCLLWTSASRLHCIYPSACSWYAYMTGSWDIWVNKQLNILSNKVDGECSCECVSSFFFLVI